MHFPHKGTVIVTKNKRMHFSISQFKICMYGLHFSFFFFSATLHLLIRSSFAFSIFLSTLHLLRSPSPFHPSSSPFSFSLPLQHWLKSVLRVSTNWVVSGPLQCIWHRVCRVSVSNTRSTCGSRDDEACPNFITLEWSRLGVTELTWTRSSRSLWLGER